MNMNALKLQRNINYGSVLPILVFMGGLLVIFFFSSELYAEGIISMLLSAILYIIMILIRSSDINPPTEFNLILENISTFMTFGISTILFGVRFYSPNTELPLILLIFFFSITTILSMARNWNYDARDSLGFPIAFNGIFLPLFYYMFKFYFKEPGSSIFLLYFFIAGILTTTNYKFLWFDDKFINNKRKQISQEEIHDKIIESRIKLRDNKEFEKIKKENTEQIKKKKTELLENSNLEKIIRYFKQKINKTDHFNDIKNMPTEKEVNETLTHDITRKENLQELLKTTTKPKKKKTLQKIIRFFYNKISKKQKETEQWNTIKEMPKEKELKKTLPHTEEIETKKEEEIKTENNNNNKEEKYKITPPHKEAKETLEKSSNSLTSALSTKEEPIEIEQEKNKEDWDTKIEDTISNNKKIRKEETIEIDGEEYDLGEYENDLK